MYTIDINCDLGESFGRYTLGEQNDILRFISSANIACGFHAGDPSVMHQTVKQAIQYGVKIGAHPGLPDLNGFGRREMQMTATEVYDLTLYQIGALHSFVTVYGDQLHHVKPHGALYNMAAKDATIAKAIAQAIYDFSPNLILYGLANSELTKAGESVGLTTAHEIFADRTYQADGTLTSRKEDGALIEEQEVATKQVLRLIKDGKVRSLQQTDVSLKADTVCIHGDGAKAIEVAENLYDTLTHHDVTIQAITT